MSRPIDTPERRQAVRASLDVAAAKRLARAHSVSMQRSRRVGPVTFDVGIRGGKSLLQRRAHGIITFTDAGELATARLFAQPEERHTLESLAVLLEVGPTPDTDAHDAAPVELVLELNSGAVGVLTGSITLPELPEEALLVPIAPEPHSIDAPSAFATSTPTASVPIIAPLTEPAADAHIVTAAELPSARTLWTRFLAASMLLLQPLLLAGLAVATNQLPWPLLALSAVLAVVGAAVVLHTIHANDRRLAALHSPGLTAVTA